MAHEVKNAKISIRCDTTGLMIPLRRVEVSLYKLYGWRRFTMLGYWRRLLARYFESEGKQ